MSYLLVLAAMAAGVFPHFANLSPAFGGLLYGGARLRRRDAIWLPLLLVGALLAVESLAVYHKQPGWGLLWSTLALAPVVFAGELLRGKRNWKRLGAASGAGATGFFVLSNFFVWGGGVLYPHTLAGLGACYLAAIPFWGNSLAATALFGGFLFAADAYLAHRRSAVAAGARS